ncbi:hypothetical protein AXF42_Ash004175 [Apostasia shenzhenica]|uniref:Uncharacterized protein n=1 Tax=Apostasia shenzhenica TaxID=1088818 RepID=A0A2I0A279_9ASPA|nr:hypothetical protein AXF42_Ash004175 [Apostasia shenzhenica]
MLVLFWGRTSVQKSAGLGEVDCDRHYLISSCPRLRGFIPGSSWTTIGLNPRARGLTRVKSPVRPEAESANQSIRYSPVGRHVFGQDAAQEPRVNTYIAQEHPFLSDVD